MGAPNVDTHADILRTRDVLYPSLGVACGGVGRVEHGVTHAVIHGAGVSLGRSPLTRPFRTFTAMLGRWEKSSPGASLGCC